MKSAPPSDDEFFRRLNALTESVTRRRLRPSPHRVGSLQAAVDFLNATAPQPPVIRVTGLK